MVKVVGASWEANWRVREVAAPQGSTRYPDPLEVLVTLSVDKGPTSAPYWTPSTYGYSRPWMREVVSLAVKLYDTRKEDPARREGVVTGSKVIWVMRPRAGAKK